MSFLKKLEEIGKKAAEVAVELGAEGQKQYAEFQKNAAEQRKVAEAEAAQKRAEEAQKKAEAEALLAQHVPSVIRYRVAANYHGGYPSMPDIIDGGELYLGDTFMVWVKLVCPSKTGRDEVESQARPRQP